MSAFICSDKHINAIVRWAGKHNVSVYHGNPSRRWDVARQEQETSEFLFAENVKSVNHRYKDDSATTGIVYDPFAPDLRPIEVIKACDCLDYQSCEHPDWEGTLACKLLKAIQSKALTKLPGYETSKWTIEA